MDLNGYTHEQVEVYFDQVGYLDEAHHGAGDLKAEAGHAEWLGTCKPVFVGGLALHADVEPLLASYAGNGNGREGLGIEGLVSGRGSGQLGAQQFNGDMRVVISFEGLVHIGIDAPVAAVECACTKLDLGAAKLKVAGLGLQLEVVCLGGVVAITMASKLDYIAGAVEVQATAR